MPNHNYDLIELLQGGHYSASELQSLLDISQGTLYTRLREVAPQVVPWGETRARRYSALRNTPTYPVPLPVYHISDGTNPHRHLFDLYPVCPRGYVLVSLSESESSSYYEDLPWFLQPLRPSGFLGRALAHNTLDLDLPPDIRLWTGDHCLMFLHTRGWDMPGAFMVGTRAYEQYLNHASLTPTEVIHPEHTSEAYPRCADQAMAGGIGESSTGGEQPKFCGWRANPDGGVTAVMVKFSPREENNITRRWVDLLHAEHLALDLLQSRGYPAVTSCLRSGGGRTFLEVERFDRVHHQLRRGVVDLLTLEAEFVGGAAPGWAGTTAALLAQRLILLEDHLLVRKMELFGRLIYNTDMHLGNFSFFLEGTHIRGPTPVYDMLPMGLAPTSQGEIRPVTFVPPSPSPADADIWPEMWGLALTFWELCQREPEISEPFKKIAADIHNKISTLASKIRLLPQPAPPPKRRGRPPKSGRS